MKAPIETVISEKNENPQKAATASGQPVRHSALRRADMSKVRSPARRPDASFACRSFRTARLTLERGLG
jgi:hypothetical protein